MIGVSERSAGIPAPLAQESSPGVDVAFARCGLLVLRPSSDVSSTPKYGGHRSERNPGAEMESSRVETGEAGGLTTHEITQIIAVGCYVEKTADAGEYNETENSPKLC